MATPPPQLAFERARGWRKLPGLGLTWLTVLFAPWIFARQLVLRGSLPHSVTFAALCFASTSLAQSGHEFQLTWLITAAINVPLQVLLLSVLDFRGWRCPLATLRFWLLATCYTSAIMPTEAVFGPPVLSTANLAEFLIGRGPLRTSFGAQSLLQTAVPVIQLGLWLSPLTACYFLRLRRRAYRPSLLPFVLTPAVVLALLAHYILVVEYVGVVWVSSWFDWW